MPLQNAPGGSSRKRALLDTALARGYQVSNLVKHLTIRLFQQPLKLHCSVKMDNLSNFGIKDDTSRAGRSKPRGKQRKPFAIECRIARRVSDGLARELGLLNWWVHSRYTTARRRDQAYAALVKKAERDGLAIRFRWKTEYRKRND